MLQNELQETSQKVITARSALLGSLLPLMAARVTLENKKAELLLSGAIDGKNAEQREAQIRQMAEGEIAAVNFAEKNHAEYQAAYDCAVIAWDNAKYQVRLLEAMKP